MAIRRAVASTWVRRRLPTSDGGHSLKLGNGQDTVQFDHNLKQLRELREALTVTITADDFADLPGAYWPWENDDRYIDWSDFEYEGGFDLASMIRA
ncbi:hypothetical protein ACTMSW_18910 [Micromonospora sp. BQ11]|uniref:hypothetical protein n=1 Tax=Micromonospora sp. BQ11 TaxID=3452212 RepID=UPI003F89EED0